MPKFEIVDYTFRKYTDTTIQLPVRSTEKAAGYDFYLNDDLVIEPGTIAKQYTDVKVTLDDDEFLWLTPRSSTGDLMLMIPQTAGIIDADYKDNPETGGNILIKLYNYGTKTQTLKAGTRVVQGIIQPYKKTDDDEASGKRMGGFGSTGR